ncbi:MAG: hypothetical protein ABIT70_10910 [Sulfuriferula sp.]
MTTKDLAYFEANPDEATIEELEALANSGMGDVVTEGDTDKQDETDNAEEVKAKPESVTTDASDKTGQEEAPIQSRDGKHTIPYNVLATERERRQQAEQAMAELQARIDSLQVQGTAAPAEVAAPAMAVGAISDEDMAALREDFPAFAKVIEAQMAKIDTLESKLSTVYGKEEQREAVEQRTVQQQVRDMIDTNPKLSALEADPAAWARAVEIDNMLKAQPENQNLSLAERFDKVVKGYESFYGAITGAAAATPTPTPVPKSAREQAEALLKEKAPATPRSLSDLPGGMPDASSEAQRAENLSEVEMGNMMLKMTPEQIEQYLNNLAA